jgi:hypothetical protein
VFWQQAKTVHGEGTVNIALLLPSDTVERGPRHGYGLQSVPLCLLPGDPMSRSVFFDQLCLSDDLAFEPTRGGNHGMTGPDCDTLE